MVAMEKVKIDSVLKINGTSFLSRLHQKGFEPGGSNTENCKINFSEKQTAMSYTYYLRAISYELKTNQCQL